MAVAQGPYCTNCGASVSAAAAACMTCGHRPIGSRSFCRNCGTAASDGQVVCTACGAPIRGAAGATGSKNKVVAGLLAIFLGGLGVHKFYLGRNSAGAIMLGGTLLGYCLGAFLIVPFLAPFVIGIIAFIEGIIYLTKSDEDFEEIYVVEGKDWF